MTVSRSSQTIVSRGGHCWICSVVLIDPTCAEGNRTTPSYVAFSSEERLIGDAAKNQAAMNPRNSKHTDRPQMHILIPTVLQLSLMLNV
jgi:hypothetical protein